MNGLNGIIIAGKVYEVVKGTWSCNGCDFNDGTKHCKWDRMLCTPFKRDCILRYSQSLTDKINEK